MEQGQLKVQMEIPWSIRNAVLNAFPDCSKDSLQYCLEQYVVDNFVVSFGDKSIHWTELRLIEAEHSHSQILQFQFPISGNKRIKIQNSLLFNTYVNPKHHHQVIFDESEKTVFVTTPDRPGFTFHFPTKTPLVFFYPMFILLPLFIAGRIVLFFIRKRKRQL